MGLILLVLACVADEVPPPFAPGADAGWWSGAPVPGPRPEHAVVALDGEVVVVAGVDDGPTTLGVVQAFDPVAGTWRDLPSLPVAVHHPNVTVVDGSIVMLGALDPAFRPVPEAWVLEPGADAWSAVSPPPRLVGSSAIAVLDGQVHVVGGLGDEGAVAWHQVWDPVDDVWTALPDAPHARDHLAWGVVDGTLVLTGGRQRALSAFVDATDRYDPVAGWRSGAPLPTPRGGVAAAVLNGRLHVVGGEGADRSDGVFADHEAYDPVADRWTTLPDMPAPRHGMGAAVVDGVMWVPGGAPVDGFGAEDVNQGFVE